MGSRMSIVGAIKVVAVREASTFHIGDSIGYNPRSRGFALNRLTTVFTGEEGDFSDPIYHEPIPKPLITEPVQLSKNNVQPMIKTGTVKITAIGNASVFQIGSTKIIDAESRIKHVRQFW